MPTKTKPTVRIRMYRHGLGDCFLLTFQRTGKPDCHLLLDCGLLQNTKDEKVIMNAVAESIAETVGEKIDVVVMTHEHWDHISGFSQAQPVFDTVKFRRVWVGWTENEDHPQAGPLRERYRKQLQGMQAAMAFFRSVPLGASSELDKLRQKIEPIVDDFLGAEILGAAKMGRSATWQYVMEKSATAPKYCEPGRVETIDGLDGVRFYILGPPADFNVFTQTEPRKGQRGDSYRHANSLAAADSFFSAVTPDDDPVFSTESAYPFDVDRRIDTQAAKSDPFFDSYYFSTSNEENAWREIDHEWMMALGGFALNIDSYTNNTCLAFAIELVESGEFLVFPGDAQFGNWLSWQDLEWEIKDTDGEKITINIEDIFKNTVFYKVGHHGSHNATLREHGLEMMTHNDLVAMIPVNRVRAEEKAWEMPEAHLFTRLQERTKGRVVIADESDKKALTQRCKDNKLSKADQDRFLANVVLPTKKHPALGGKPLYVEYILK